MASLLVKRCHKCGTLTISVHFFDFYINITANKNNQCYKCSDNIILDLKTPVKKYTIKKVKPSPIIGRMFFEPTFGREISTSEIKKLCREHDYVYADDNDLTKDCEKNKKENEAKQIAEFRKRVFEGAMKELA